MGKGKDRNKKKGLTTSLQSMSLSDAPSTSEEPTAESSASTSFAALAETAPATAAAPVEAAEEEEFSGLTGGKKGGKKKKKGAVAVSTPAETAVSPTSETTPSDVNPTPPSVVPTQLEEPEEAIGLGLGTTKKRPPRKRKPKTAESILSTEQPPPSGLAPTMSATSPVAALPQAQTASGRVWSASQSGAPSLFPKQASSQTAPSQSAHSISAQESPPKYAALPGAAQVQLSDDSKAQRKPSETPLCRFKIPKKIEGNSVPVQRVAVLTNYLLMTFKPLKVYRYDISFKPERPKKLLAKAFNISKNEYFPKHLIAFDQSKNCYTLNMLPKVPNNDRFVTHVELKDNNGKTLKFEVSYKATGTVDLSTIHNYMKTGGTSLSPPTEAIQCVDVILRQGTLEAYVKAGRQFFLRPARPIDLGDGLEMWTGLFQSAIFTSKAFINIDVAHKGFPKHQPLLEALTKDFRLDPNKPLTHQRGFEAFQAFLKGLRVVAKVGGDVSASGMRREFICNEVVGTATQEHFTYDDHETGKSRKMTVADYFHLVKKVKIRYPSLNCLWVGPRDKSIYYPIELLEVSYGQAQNKQLNERQLATMVREAATPPDERKRKIEAVIQNMNYSKNENFTKFGLNISTDFHPVTAKILRPPNLEVGGGQIIQPRRGAWQANRVYRAEALSSWGFIAIEVDGTRCNYTNIMNILKDAGKQMGMQVAEPKMCKVTVRINELRNVLLDALVAEVKFLFVIVSSRGRDYYHKVKQMAERDVGILTQCIKEQTAIMRMNMQTARNILLKVNSKLMGINQVLEVRSLPRCLASGGVMVVGADVTHPSPDQSNIPSIAAVTASIDPKCFIYNIELSIQTPKKEMIVEFEDMMVDHFRVYHQRQQMFPKKIFVFRDGVSEGQFAQVLNSELQAVHNAYKRVCGPQAKPEVLFLLVQKRHHTRLFLPNSNQNVEPGTVVDTEIVHASELDFYLVSHHAIKGTARPTRYHAVCNDGGLKHDEVEELTYYLCHLYSRCMRAVSYPTPTYYAHLACFRARSLTYGERFDNQELEKQPKRLRVMDKILKFSRMFFV